MAMEISNSTKSYATTDVSTAKPETRVEQTQQVSPDTNFSTNEGAAQVNVPGIEGNSNQLSGNAVKQAISDMNKKINPNTIAQYGFHDETNRVTIKLVDKDTDKVIKEFPAEETLDMIAKVWELAGMFLDEKG